jgi:8-oxo-dGTP pyrophosphatase MutT (NUDIX family)
MPIGRFLCGIAALIWDPATDRYLLLRRSAQKDYGAGSWECVTGHVDQGESFTQAVQREVREELGTAVKIEFLVGVTHFYRGEAIPEKELLGAIFGCTLEDAAAARHGDEHSEMRWASAAEIEGLLPANHWLLPALRRAEALRHWLPEELRRTFRVEGFEID